MSSKEIKKDKKVERPRAMGPSGFPLLEYRGADKDHSTSWIQFKKNLKGSILTHRLDNLVGDVIDFNIRPEVPSLDKDALLKNEPKKTITVQGRKSPSEEIDNPLFETEYNIIFMDEYRAMNKRRVERVVQIDERHGDFLHGDVDAMWPRYAQFYQEDERL